MKTTRTDPFTRGPIEQIIPGLPSWNRRNRAGCFVDAVKFLPSPIKPDAIGGAQQQGAGYARPVVPERLPPTRLATGVDTHSPPRAARPPRPPRGVLRQADDVERGVQEAGQHIPVVPANVRPVPSVSSVPAGSAPEWRLPPSARAPFPPSPMPPPDKASEQVTRPPPAAGRPPLPVSGLVDPSARLVSATATATVRGSVLEVRVRHEAHPDVTVTPDRQEIGLDDAAVFEEGNKAPWIDMTITPDQQRDR